MTPNIFYLSEVSYLAEKRQIIAVFSSGRLKRSARYSFFPFLHLPKSDAVSCVLFSHDLKKIKIEEKNDAFEVIGSTMEELEKILYSLKQKGLDFSVIEPQRQFLLLSNWSFFDTFSFETGLPQKIGSFPDAQVFPVIEKNLSSIFRLLLHDSDESARFFLKKICLSHILRIHPSEQRFQNPLKGLFENWFFSESKPIPGNFSESLKKSISSENFGTVFDFSPVYLSLLVSHNIGIETINCECCVPSLEKDPNVLPTSFVNVEFLLNGFYFESKNIFWAGEFHSSKPFADHRLNRKNEWFLSSIPVGPFYKGDVLAIPLVDVKHLDKKAVNLLGVEKFSWFCKKKTSFLAKSLAQLLSLRGKVLNEAAFFESESLARSGVLSFALKQENFRLACLDQFASTIEGLVFSVPDAISSNTQFFGPGLSESFSCLSEEYLANFCSLAEKNNFQTLFKVGSRIFVACERPLALAEVFSSSFGLPKPLILSQSLSEKT